MFFRSMLPYSYSEKTDRKYLILNLLKLDSSEATVTALSVAAHHAKLMFIQAKNTILPVKIADYRE